MMYAMGVLGLICLVETLLLWRVARSLGSLERFEDRLAQFGGALTLLTETTESGFRSLAIELARTGKPGLAGSRGVTRRVVRAARQGRSPLEIAAREELAESDVRLRLHLGETEASYGASSWLAKEA
ncbi:MAG TPA: hypothetical protein VIC33_06555 [Vicinamibacterales bacterium]|jgi:hypothetical protein